VEGYGSPKADTDFSSYVDQTLSNDESAFWEGIWPQAFYEDTNCVKNTYYTHLPSVAQPLACQSLGKRTTVEFSTTYNGQANVRVVSPGACPGHLGRKQAFVQYGFQGDIENRHRTSQLFQAGIESPLNLAKRIGTLHTVAGNDTCSFHTDAAPEYYWRNWGILDAVDAPATGVISTTNNFHPREQVTSALNVGMIIIENNSATDALVVNFSSKASWAVQLPHDENTSTALSALAIAARMQAEPMVPHFPPDSEPAAFHPPIMGKNGADLTRQHVQALGPVGSLHGERPHTVATVQHTGIATRLFDGAKRVVAGVSNVLGGVYNGVRSVINKIGGIGTVGALMSRIPGRAGMVGRAISWGSSLFGNNSPQQVPQIEQRRKLRMLN